MQISMATLAPNPNQRQVPNVNEAEEVPLATDGHPDATAEQPEDKVQARAPNPPARGGTGFTFQKDLVWIIFQSYHLYSSENFNSFLFYWEYFW